MLLNALRGRLEAAIAERRAVLEAEELDRRIDETSEGWPAGRMGVLERNILRIGIHELEAGTVPVEVAISEAVTLAMRYTSDEAGRLVIGILARVAQEKAA